MSYFKAKFNSSKTTDEGVISTLEYVGRGFTISLRYTHSPVTAAAIVALADEGRTKKLAARGGDDLAIAAYHDFLIKARATLKLLVNFVNSVAAGDKTAVIESGFDCSTPGVHGVKSKHSAKGSTFAGAIDIYYNPHARCGGVSHQVCVDPPTEDGYLAQRMSNPGTFTWLGLTSGQKVWTRSCYAVAGGQSGWSDPIPVFVP